MKIKLRDLSEEQYKKWCNKNCSIVPCKKCIFGSIVCDNENRHCWIKNKDFYNDKFLNQEIEMDSEYLTEEENEYLSAVIKPFRDRIEYIEKGDVNEAKKIQFIKMSLDSCFVHLPDFEPYNYKNMEVDRRYTLEELGL